MVFFRFFLPMILEIVGLNAGPYFSLPGRFRFSPVQRNGRHEGAEGGRTGSPIRQQLAPLVPCTFAQKRLENLTDSLIFGFADLGAP